MFFRRKEKIFLCVTTADTLCSSPGLKTGGVNVVLLSFAMESLLQMCNDVDSDVRMTADESLNRIVRVSDVSKYNIIYHFIITQLLFFLINKLLTSYLFIFQQAVTDSNVMKVQVELHKEIKRNGNARSLRAALWRFAYLSHMIRFLLFF